MLERELLRVRDQLHQLSNGLQNVLVAQAETKTVVDNLQDTLGTIQAACTMIPTLDRRIWLLERIVLTAAGAILLAVLGVWISGAVRP